MEYYFFLKDPYTDAEITVSNFPPTPTPAFRPRENVVCMATLRGKKWWIQSLGSLGPFKSRTFRASDFNETEEEIRRSVLFLSPEIVSGPFDTLPHFEGFSSSPSWRANLRIRSKSSCVSYQGEYPGRMLDLNKGTLVSIGPLLQQREGVKNKVFLVNFKRDAVTLKGQVLFKRLQSSELLKKVDIVTNSINYVDLSDLSLKSDAELVLALSTGCTCIPIYFSHSEDYRYLSLEHTHPPTEWTVFGKGEGRLSIVSKMKQFWLDEKRCIETAYR